MRAQFADKTFRSGHVRVRNVVDAIMQMLMRSDIPAAAPEGALRRHDAAFNVPALKDRRRRMRLKSRAVNASSSMTKTIGFHGAGEVVWRF